MDMALEALSSALVIDLDVVQGLSNCTQDIVVGGEHFMLPWSFRPPQDSHLQGSRIRVGQVGNKGFGTWFWQHSGHFAHGFNDMRLDFAQVLYAFQVQVVFPSPR